jgi:hypothetical protein
MEVNSLTPSHLCQSQNTHSQLEPKDDISGVIELLVETVPTTELDKRLEQKAVEKIDWVPKQYSEVAAELPSELCNHIRVLNIEHQNPELVTNIAQTFELTFAGVRVDFEGYPEALIILFKQMQNNPAFTKEVLQYAKLLATGV